MESTKLIEAVAAGQDPYYVAKGELTEITKEGGVVDPHVFTMALSSFVTQYDQRQSKRSRFYNPNALAMYLKVVHDIQDDAQKKGILKKSDPESIKTFKKMIERGRYFTHDFPPYKKILKAIDEYLTKGTPPNIAPKSRKPRGPRKPKADWSKVPDNSAEVSAALKGLETALKPLYGHGKLTDPDRTPNAQETADALVAVWKAAKMGHPSSRKEILTELRMYLKDARDHAKRMQRVGHTETMAARDIRDMIDMARAKVSKLKDPPKIKESAASDTIRGEFMKPGDMINAVALGESADDVVDATLGEAANKYLTIGRSEAEGGEGLTKKIVAALKKAGIKHSKPRKSPIPDSLFFEVDPKDWEKAADIKSAIERDHWKSWRKKHGKGEFRK